MLIKEFRIVMPLTVEEYQIGQLYSVAEVSMNNTGGGEGIEVVKNEPFDNVSLLGGHYTKGQYTMKKYHLASKVPGFISMLVSNDSMEMHEETWNAYPYCRTVITNPAHMKEDFTMVIESLHLAGKGDQDNVHELSPEKLKVREVVMIDIADRDAVENSDYNPSEDPSKFHSHKCGRGPLSGKWQDVVDPVMTCYKLVTVEFKWFGLQGRTENFIQRAEKRLFTNFYRQVFCWIDKWHGMTMADIRQLEDHVQEELNKQRGNAEARGMTSEME